MQNWYISEITCCDSNFMLLFEKNQCKAIVSIELQN